MVDDAILYFTKRVIHERLPEFDAAFFASGSAVEAFADVWGVGKLNGKPVLAIGAPTADTLARLGVDQKRVIVPPSATVESAIHELARHQLNDRLNS